MKITKFAAIALIAIATLCAFIMPAVAEELVKDFKIQSLVTAQDKNGNDYARFIAQEAREKDGVKYTVGVPVMIFSGSSPDLYKAIATKKDGDIVKLVVQTREYQGRTSYTALAMGQPAAKKQ